MAIKNLEFVNSNDTGGLPSSWETEVFVNSSGSLSKNTSSGVVTTFVEATNGVQVVTAAKGIVSDLATTNQRIVPFFGAGVQATPAAAAAIPLTNYHSTLDSNAGATTQTLAASTIVGQVKKITMVVDGGDDVVTVTSLTGGTTITFSNVGDTVELMWNWTAWIVLARYNCATGAITTPVIA